MCDTAVVFAGDGDQRHSCFAKNSDRDAAELQMIEVSLDPAAEFAKRPYFEYHNSYQRHCLPALRSVFSRWGHPYRAVISRPVWMWGAEMGINECGVAIGNEAVFANAAPAKAGLLGMDILRLALHNAATAEEACQFIIEVIESHGQGGDGGYQNSLYYHNSFLMKDSSSAYLLETAGRQWAVKRVTDTIAISNTYSIQRDFDIVASGSQYAVTGFKDAVEDREQTAAVHGEERLQYSRDFLDQAEPSFDAMKALLRSHGRSGGRRSPGPDALCMHSASGRSTATTASMIVEYVDGEAVIWLTGAANPCTSLFKPMPLRVSWDSCFSDPEFGLAYARENHRLALWLERQQGSFHDGFDKRRDEAEKQLREEALRLRDKNSPQQAEALLPKALSLEEEFWQRVCEEYGG